MHHLHLRSRLANGAKRSRLLARLRRHIVQDHSKGTLRWEIIRLSSESEFFLCPSFQTRLTNSAEKPRSLCSVDALALNVEEESLVALKVGAGAALLAVLPRVPHHLPVRVNLVKCVQRCYLYANEQLMILPQLRTKRHRFRIQRWCTCCGSLPVKNGPEMYFDLLQKMTWSPQMSENKFHESFGLKDVTSSTGRFPNSLAFQVSVQLGELS